jgi:acyl-coenzyme A thioesterase PaaI-like protein
MDLRAAALIRKEAASLRITKELESDPNYLPSHSAYETFLPEHKAHHLCAGPNALGTSHVLGAYQQVYSSPSTGSVVVVVWLGPGATGWPGIVHGGVLGTLVDETCARAAFPSLAASGGIGVGKTAYMKVKYLSPSLARGFYVVRARVRPDEELDEKDRGKRDYKAFLDAVVEDAVTGKVQVVGEALYVGTKVDKANASKFGKPDPSILAAESVALSFERF